MPTNDAREYRLQRRAQCRTVGSVRHQIAERIDDLVTATRTPQRTRDAETLGAEIIPLCDALKFIAKRGPGVLRDRKIGVRGRPLWMWGAKGTVIREPLGTVLVLAPWNYPLLLPGTQVAQALAAGNRVVLKPAPGCETLTEILVDCFHQAGISKNDLCQVGSDVKSAKQQIDMADLVVLTGSAGTGRQVLRQTAASLTPAIMELSGCDAMVVLPSADLDRVVECIRFGLTLNSGATCIGPRRLIVHQAIADDLRDRLRSLSLDRELTVHPKAVDTAVESIEDAVERGASDLLGSLDLGRLRSDGVMRPLILQDVSPESTILDADVFAPVTSLVVIADHGDAVRRVNECSYRLAASVFGSADQAEPLAGKLDVGGVTINDLIAPTADPRIPFGGRGASGFGVTRGAEGLLAMTTPKVIMRRRGRVTPHLWPPEQVDAGMLAGTVKMLHGSSVRKKFAGLRRAMRRVHNSGTPRQPD